MNANLQTVATERVNKVIENAVKDLRDAAEQVAKKYGIPPDVAGHLPGELLGRIAYVPSMSRDLRKALITKLVPVELNKAFEPAAPAQTPAPPPLAPAGDRSASNVAALDSVDIAQLKGITPATVKSLRAAGLNSVAELARIPIEHLTKVAGIGPRLAQQIRSAITASVSEQVDNVQDNRGS